jgi:hypothetical protein
VPTPYIVCSGSGKKRNKSFRVVRAISAAALTKRVCLRRTLCRIGRLRRSCTDSDCACCGKLPFPNKWPIRQINNSARSYNGVSETRFRELLNHADKFNRRSHIRSTLHVSSAPNLLCATECARRVCRRAPTYKYTNWSEALVLHSECDESFSLMANKTCYYLFGKRIVCTAAFPSLCCHADAHSATRTHHIMH